MRSKTALAHQDEKMWVITKQDEKEAALPPLVTQSGASALQVFVTMAATDPSVQRAVAGICLHLSAKHARFLLLVIHLRILAGDQYPALAR
jgi:hypothetical protein